MMRRTILGARLPLVIESLIGNLPNVSKRKRRTVQEEVSVKSRLPAKDRSS